MKHILNYLKKYKVVLLLFLLYITFTYFTGIDNCVSKIVLGIPCPGCGMTRAGFSLLHFDFTNAFKFNPFIFVFPIILIVIIFKDAKYIKKIHNSHLFWLSLILFVVVTFIIRFILIYPNPPFDLNDNSLLHQIIKIFKNII